MTAHQGMVEMSFVVGKGWGRMRNAPTKKNEIIVNEMAEASHGLIMCLLSWPFMAAPHVCKAPPRMMKGITHPAFIRFVLLYRLRWISSHEALNSSCMRVAPAR